MICMALGIDDEFSVFYLARHVGIQGKLFWRYVY